MQYKFNVNNSIQFNKQTNISFVCINFFTFNELYSLYSKNKIPKKCILKRWTKFYRVFFSETIYFFTLYIQFWIYLYLEKQI